ncbi:dethiobiotin synthase [Pseudoalteromonas sp. HM-SA03]|uniref:methyltransferase domain-containing protein n=1 Tax=Pseudoalteromonas sp. HM-SA03 TaxID=2029678 RepID=UPI000BAE49D5|nr:methyltransferase domain-containing protein [Pseudoalteromonas sp. HM-SA03]PAY02902.1 dethiobiotin synthase [Pseudoalteromonas sp. HM-SA03]
MSRAQKTQTAKCFSKAAQSYSQHANVQKQAADILFSRLTQQNSELGAVRMFPRLLDLGCGPHENFHRLNAFTNHYVGADLSLAMLASAENTTNSVCCDMDKLAIQSNCIDLVFSNFAIQWSNSPQALFAQLYEVLKKEGRVLLSSVLDGSLNEIDSAWRAIDQCGHINSFYSLSALKSLALQAGFAVTWAEEALLIDSYDTPLKALRSVKNIGANDVKTTSRRQGLLGKSAYAQLLSNYPESENGFDVSYQVGFLELRK